MKVFVYEPVSVFTNLKAPTGGGEVAVLVPDDTPEFKARELAHARYQGLYSMHLLCEAEAITPASPAKAKGAA